MSNEPEASTAAERKRIAVHAEVDALIDRCAATMAVRQSRWNAGPTSQQIENIGAMIGEAARLLWNQRKEQA